jgi:hypothetical protein
MGNQVEPYSVKEMATVFKRLPVSPFALRSASREGFRRLASASQIRRILSVATPGPCRSLAARCASEAAPTLNHNCHGEFGGVATADFTNSEELI